jgi:type II secretory pathway component PulF
MRLSFRDKAAFYQQTGRLLRSGISLPQALERLSTAASSSMRGFLRTLGNKLRDGATFSEALAATRSITEMERSSVDALERSGRLDQGLEQLAKYYEAMARARGEIIRRSAYPLFIFHFGVLLMNLPMLFSAAGVAGYVRSTGTLLIVFYGIVAFAAFLVPILRDSGANSASMDRLLRMVPLIGKIRRAFALSRFCAAYDIQLNAGVNVMDSLNSAARASRSGLVRDAVKDALPELRNGSQVGPLLAKHSAFPRDMKQALLVAEETGSLDEELPRLAEEYQHEGLTRLSSFSEWMPKLIYFAVVVFLAWNIIAGYSRYVEGMMRLIDSL